MQRRQFLERSGTAVLAITGLPLLMRKRRLISQFTGEKMDANKVKWLYDLEINLESVTKFTGAREEQKVITLKVSQPPATGASTADNTKNGEYHYVISSVLLTEYSPKTAELKAKFTAKANGSLTLPPDLPKDLDCIVRPFLDVTLRDTKGKDYVKLSYKSNTSVYDDEDDYDCFLTTACVFHKGLPDDCHELQTIRFLRENYMRGTTHGEMLLEEYDTVGPAILRSLREAENRKEILDHLYNHLVVPSVEKIESGRYQEAINYYAGYVESMKQQYL